MHRAIFERITPRIQPITNEREGLAIFANPLRWKGDLMSEKITSIRILEETSGEERRVQTVAIEKNGDLVVYGLDSGPFVEKYHGDGDYEYWFTVPGEYKDTILLLLLKERFSSFLEIQTWLTSKGIKSERGFM